MTESDVDDRREYVRRPTMRWASMWHRSALPLRGRARTAARWAIRGAMAPSSRCTAPGNRSPRAGYKVIFVPFGDDGEPLDALPIDVLTGFLSADGKAMGRPADARQTSDGALLVADDVGNIIWRVTRSGGSAAPAPSRPPAR